MNLWLSIPLFYAPDGNYRLTATDKPLAPYVTIHILVSLFYKLQGCRSNYGRFTCCGLRPEAFET